MKSILLFVSLLMLFSCGTENTTKEKTKLLTLDWLLGKWQRTDDPAGKQTFEFWEKKSPNEYMGLGFTLENQDTVFKENMRLIPVKGTWNLEVTGVNESPTFFHFIQQNATSFTCENEQNEFPKKIIYEVKDKKLFARISAGETEIPFTFIFIGK